MNIVIIAKHRVVICLEMKKEAASAVSFIYPKTTNERW